MIRDAGDQPRGKSRKPNVRAPDAPSLFDISDNPPPTPLQVRSSTSIDAAKEIDPRAMTQRRRVVLGLLKGTKPGLARFQVANRLGVPEHWLSSTFDALIKMRKVEESPDLTIVNPKSGRACAVLLWIDSGELERSA